MRILIDDLLTYSRTNTSERKLALTDLNKLVGQVTSKFSDLIKIEKAVLQCDPQGRGVGLAICKKIVDNHEGLIIAEGKENQGVSFHIYLLG